MGFKRVGGDPSVIAPDFIKQGFAGHRFVACPEQEFQDRGFLFRQADFLFTDRFDQNFCTGLEAIGANDKDRVLALFMLADVGADARQKYIEAERLGDIIIGTRFKAKDGVGITIGPG